MNRQYPLTDAGCKELQKALYQLPDEQLKAQAEAVLMDFRAWVIVTFELNDEQITFLEQINEDTVEFMSAVCSFAIENRLPINLDKQEASKSKDGPPLKIIEAQSRLTSSSSSDGSHTNGGDVTVQIRYGN